MPHDLSSGLPGVGTAVPVCAQGSRDETASSVQPGQNGQSVISPGPAEGYVSTGAGHGEPVIDRSYRYPWQQRPMGA